MPELWKVISKISWEYAQWNPVHLGLGNCLTSKRPGRASTKIDYNCKEANDEMNKLSIEIEALRGNLKATASRNIEQEKTINFLKQDLADFKFNASNESEATKRLEKYNDQLW